jgi:hypothetical protein
MSATAESKTGPAQTPGSAPLVNGGLVVDASFRSRRRLMTDLHESGIVKELVEAQSVGNGLELLISRLLSLCVIGPTLTPQSAVEFVTRGRQVTAGKECAFVAVVSENSAAAEALAGAGAAQLLTFPYEPTDFRAAILDSLELSRQEAADYRPPLVEPAIALPDSLAGILIRAAREFRTIALEIERGGLKLTAGGEPTLSTREAIRRVIERAVDSHGFDSQVRGSFENFFVSAAVNWFVERAHSSERSCTENLRRRLISFK